MTASFAIKEPNILPIEYNYDIEAELKQIIFSKNIAEQHDKYVQSIAKVDEHKIAYEI